MISKEQLRNLNYFKNCQKREIVEKHQNLKKLQTSKAFKINIIIIIVQKTYDCK